MTRLLMLAMVLLATTAQAQLPDWYPDPINQVKQLTRQNAKLRADLFSCDSLLTLTFADAGKVIDLKEQRIQTLIRASNDSLKAESAKRQITATAVSTLLNGLSDLERMETDEALMSRLFGSGRKRAAKARRDYIIQLKAKVSQ